MNILPLRTDTYIPEPLGPDSDGTVPILIQENIDDTDPGVHTFLDPKKKISNNATIGLYYFSSTDLYMKAYNEYYSEQGNLEKGEKYIAPLYNYLIKENYIVRISIIPFENVHVIGTPEELEEFRNSDYYKI